MQRFIYPAIFYKDEETVRVLFPDIELATDGAFVEEAYLYAKEFLRQYFVQVLKYDFDYNKPSSIDEVKSKCKSDDIVMLVEAEVKDKDWK